MRKRKKKNRISEDVDQLTLSKFADSKSVGSRMSKSSQTSNFTIKVDADIEIESDEEDDEVIFENRQSKSVVKMLDKWTDGVNYPYDLWEILSQYISPESVGKFACLCKSAYLSINCASFWLNLHQIHAAQVSRNYYWKKGKEILPVKFQSDYVNRFCQGNLRSIVIRSLFFTHEPFKKKLLSLQNKNDPHSIVGLVCIGAWTSRKTSTYRFCFKVSSTQNSMKTYRSGLITKRNDDEPWYLQTTENKTDISISPEESCQLLQVDCDAYNPLPGSVCGLRIHSINITSSGEGFRYQKISMILGPPHFRKDKDSNGRLRILSPHSVIVDIGNITAINLVKWYHPLFYTV